MGGCFFLFLLLQSLVLPIESAEFQSPSYVGKLNETEECISMEMKRVGILELLLIFREEGSWGGCFPHPYLSSVFSCFTWRCFCTLDDSPYHVVEWYISKLPLTY
ncbi:hypothetical protein CEXT_774381 [Caerostris extrusa]|uniref:Secreted protein n=1 Tax=Caerostris extrusa TaxID=172846 RepID=A0AAV4X2W0_CAEEX|nr:hypothetical protein CEXT_774381 [Caerostris extrusa]